MAPVITMVFSHIVFGNIGGRIHHGIRAVRYDNIIAFAIFTIVNYDVPVGIRHSKTINHHKGLDVNIKGTPPPHKHVAEMCVFEI